MVRHFFNKNVPNVSCRFRDSIKDVSMEGNGHIISLTRYTMQQFFSQKEIAISLPLTNLSSKENKTFHAIVSDLTRLVYSFHMEMRLKYEKFDTVFGLFGHQQCEFAPLQWVDSKTRSSSRPDENSGHTCQPYWATLDKPKYT